MNSLYIGLIFGVHFMKKNFFVTTVKFPNNKVPNNKDLARLRNVFKIVFYVPRGMDSGMYGVDLENIDRQLHYTIIKFSFFAFYSTLMAI